MHALSLRQTVNRAEQGFQQQFAQQRQQLVDEVYNHVAEQSASWTARFEAALTDKQETFGELKQQLERSRFQNLEKTP